MENVPYVVPLVRLIASAHQVNIVVVVVKIVIVLDHVMEYRVKIVTTARGVNLVVVLMALVAAINVTQIMGSENVRQLIILMLLES